MKGLGHLREQEKSLHNWVAYKKEEKGEENWKKDRSVPLRGFWRKGDVTHSENPTHARGSVGTVRSLWDSWSEWNAATRLLKAGQSKTYAQSPWPSLNCVSASEEESWVVNQGRGPLLVVRRSSRREVLP